MARPSLRKCRKQLIALVKKYRRKRDDLSLTIREELRELLQTLQSQILQKDREASGKTLAQLTRLSRIHLDRSPLLRALNYTIGLIGALIVALIIRQMWFEPYEIPTGSMRPTFKEKDRLIVTKNPFGINIPLTTDHLLFDPALVQRAGTFVFTCKDMDVPDADALYFWIFPGKKQFVKRLMGKPGDTLYFYGGQIYGIDSEGRDITAELQPNSLSQIDHIPFISFSGKAATPSKPSGSIYSPAILSQMNEPVAKLSLNAQNRVEGELIGSAKGAPKSADYGDLWGMKNFAMVRMLTKAEALKLYNQVEQEGDLYLEFTHDPSLKNGKIEKDIYGRLRPSLATSASLIPLDASAIENLKKSLYTARFSVKDGFLHRYGYDSGRQSTLYAPHLVNVPDGMYEFYYGKAYAIKWQGLCFELPSDHPLYHLTQEEFQLLFNLGIEFDTRFEPQSRLQVARPSRFAYYKNGDLYVMGGPLYTKENPILVAFTQLERAKPAPFIDHGAPLAADGSIDKELLKTYGLKIPAGHYLALGDNYAMSSDSRDFGFVPEGNIRGAPDFIFWPFGSRFGKPNQPHMPLIVLPRAVIWMIALLIWGLYSLYHRRHYKLPMKIE